MSKGNTIANISVAWTQFQLLRIVRNLNYPHAHELWLTIALNLHYGPNTS